MNDFLLVSIFSAISGSLSAYLASRKGLNPLKWGIIGVLFGLLTLLILAFIRRKPQITPRAAPAAVSLSIPDSMNGLPWHYVDQERNKQGPMSLNWMEEAFLKGKVGKTTLVWNEQLDQWVPLSHFLK